MGCRPPRVNRALGNSPPTLPEHVGERRKENGASVRMLRPLLAPGSDCKSKAGCGVGHVAAHEKQQHDHDRPAGHRLEHEQQMQRARRRLAVLRIETDEAEQRVADRDGGGDAELLHQVQKREQKGRAAAPAACPSPRGCCASVASNKPEISSAIAIIVPGLPNRRARKVHTGEAIAPPMKLANSRIALCASRSSTAAAKKTKSEVKDPKAKLLRNWTPNSSISGGNPSETRISFRQPIPGSATMVRGGTRLIANSAIGTITRNRLA